MAAATRRSAAAMSGRRSSSSDGTPAGTAGGASLSGATAIEKRRRRLADQHRDRVLERRAPHVDVHRLRPRRLELRLGLRDVGLRGDAALEAVLRQLERLLERLDRGVEQLAIAIDAAQREVVGGELGVQAEPRGFEIGGARLRVRRGWRSTALWMRPHTSASYDTSTGSRKSLYGLVERRAGAVARLLGARRPTGATSTVGNRLARVPRTRARACANCASAACSVWFETSICCFEGVQLRIAEQLPPVAAQPCVGRLRAIFQSAFSRKAGATSTVGLTYSVFGAQARAAATQRDRATAA